MEGARLYRCIGFQQITSLTGSTALTIPLDPVTGSPATKALIHAEGQAVRWLQTGSAPSATVGMRLLVGAELEATTQLDVLRFTEEAASAKLNISYYA